MLIACCLFFVCVLFALWLLCVYVLVALLRWLFLACLWVACCFLFVCYVLLSGLCCIILFLLLAFGGLVACSVCGLCLFCVGFGLALFDRCDCFVVVRCLLVGCLVVCVWLVIRFLCA